MVVPLLAALLQGCASARPPRWVDSPPKGYTNEYFVGEAVDASRQRAKEMAVVRAQARAAESRSVTVGSTTERLEKAKSATEEQKVAGSLESELISAVRTSSAAQEIVGMRLIEEYEYRQANQSQVWVLMAVPRTESIRKIPSRRTAVFRSVVLPGWGQYTIGHEIKGLTIGATVLSSLPTAVALKNSEKQNRRLAEATLIQQSRIDYTNKANTLGSLSNVALAVAGASWVFGIVNAASAPFKLYVDAGPHGPGLKVQINMMQWWHSGGSSAAAEEFDE